jgi:hypothetical protein
MVACGVGTRKASLKWESFCGLGGLLKSTVSRLAGRMYIGSLLKVCRNKLQRMKIQVSTYGGV